ncbi:MAG TPA: hypothetical protein VJB87_05690 [Candidatus Nanoarchaeia archaeon]|nr:hypothetical protein [Candidatus Nanoarchaeia archaeon]
MTLQIVLPFGKKKGVKDLVFSILTKEYPLRLIELTNYIRKRYGKSVTFQAVRKAVLELLEEKVLITEGTGYKINKEWVKETKAVVDRIYSDIYEEQNVSPKIESIEGEITVFTVHSLNEMMRFWQSLIADWFKQYKETPPKLNVYQAAHSWEALIHLEKEREVMSKLKEKGIKSYALYTSNTPLDKSIKRFYESIGLKVVLKPSVKHFDRGYYVGTYSDMILQVRCPPELAKRLDNFFKKNKSLEDFDLQELSAITSKKELIKITVIKNAEMAKQINKSILSEMD